MSSQPPTKLRRHRRTWALTQRELAMLLGHTSDSAIGKYEWHARTPSTNALIGFEFIFAQPFYELFPTMGVTVIRTVLGNALSLRDRLASKSDPASARKLRLLDELIIRSTRLISAYE